jgi:hypothetical protein
MITEKVNLIPTHNLDPEPRMLLTEKVCKYYKVQGRLAFVHVNLLDNRSEFLSPLEITIRLENGQYLMEASQAVAIANALAYLSELLHPSAIFLGLSRQNLMRQSFRYFLLGEGETGVMVYAILQHFWEIASVAAERPCIFLMSD